MLSKRKRWALMGTGLGLAVSVSAAALMFQLPANVAKAEATVTAEVPAVPVTIAVVENKREKSTSEAERESLTADLDKLHAQVETQTEELTDVQNHIAGARIPLDKNFRRIETERSRESNCLTATGHKYLCFQAHDLTPF